jgi:hypothetical protein
MPRVDSCQLSQQNRKIPDFAVFILSRRNRKVCALESHLDRVSGGWWAVYKVK